MLAEVKTPIKTFVRAAPTAVAIVSVLYILANVAYFAAIPRDQLLSSGMTIAGRFFLNVKNYAFNSVDLQVFGDNSATHALPALIAVSALGNVIAVVFTAARRIFSSHVVGDCQ